MWNLGWSEKGRRVDEATPKKRGKKGRSRRKGYHRPQLPTGDLETYAERDAYLATLGYKSYSAYLKSALWKRLRKRVLRTRSGHPRPCRLCGLHSTHAHHHKYTAANLSGRSRKGLVPLCSRCHTKIEFRRNGSKRSIPEVQGAYSRIAKDGGKAARTEDQRRCADLELPITQEFLRLARSL